jgi:hypothetical protein
MTETDVHRNTGREAAVESEGAKEVQEDGIVD